MSTPPKRLALAAALILFCALSLSATASAATFTVNSTADTPDVAVSDGVCADSSGACTLRAAIQEARITGGGDTVNITATGTINLTGALPDLPHAIKINGPGSSRLTVRRDAGGDYRIFTALNVDADISGLTLTNGRAQYGGGIYQTNVTTLTDVVVTGNSTLDGPDIITTDQNVRGGDAGPGGGIMGGGTLTMINCVVSNNTTGKGGRGGYGGLGGWGGGIMFGGGTLTMTNVVVSGNRTGDSGEGNGPVPRASNSGYGGGLSISSFQGAAGATLTNVTVTDNATGDVNGGSAGNGGGIMVFAGPVTVRNSTVSGNRTGSGTGVNGQGGLGGGIFNNGTLTVVGSTISGNTTGISSTGGGLGGGIFNNDLTIHLTNTTISGNSTGGTGGSGGGVSRLTQSSTMTNCTVTGNTAFNNQGSGVSGTGGVIRNTIIAGNGPADAPDATGTFVSQGHNLVGKADAGTGFTAAGDKAGTTAAPLDALLGPLAENGGPTRTHALLAGSPALDAGASALAVDSSNSALTTDQRGAARSRPAVAGIGSAIVDIGAFEFQSSPADVSNKATSEDTPLTFFVTVGDSDPAGTSVAVSSSNQSLVPDANLSVAGTGPIRALTVAPAANQSGATVITLNFASQNGHTESDTFTLTVNPVNDAPTFTNGANQSVNEDSGAQSIAGWAGAPSAGPADESGQSLTFQITGNTNPGLFSAAPAVSAAGTLTYAPAPNASGVATVTVVLRDSGGTANGGQDASAAHTFQIAVNAVNDAPAVTLPAAQSVAENTSLTFFASAGSRIAVSDVDAQTGLVAATVTVTGGTATLSRTFGLTFTAGDGSGDATQTFTGTVANINFALDGLIFTPTRGFTGAALLAVSVNDQGNTGVGGPLADAGATTVNVLEGGSLQFASAAYMFPENAGAVTVTVTRTGGAAGQTAIRYTASNGTAASGTDYLPATATLSFGAGETTKTFFVALLNDNFNEGDETVNLTLSNVTGSGEIGSPATTVLIIANDDTPTVAFKNAAYASNEGDARALIAITRSGDTSAAASILFQTVDDPAAVPCDPAAKRPDGTPYPRGAAYARCDYATTVETVAFAAGEVEKQISVPVIDDAHADGAETVRLRLLDAQGATVGTRAEAQLTITDNDAAGAANPIRTTPFFVRMQYLDFLSREPEQGEPWSNILLGCANVDNTDPASPAAGCDRLRVSQSFFESPEFALKGFYSFLFYRVAFDRRPEYAEITPDMRSLAGATQQEVFTRRTQYAALFAQRPEFAQAYGAMTNQQYVDALLGRHNLTQITTEDPANFEGTAQLTFTRQQLVDALAGNSLSRAQVLRAVVQSSEVDAAEYHGAFVSMQYYGYLRRTPEQSGYDAWLRVIRQDPQNVRLMVDGFVNSQEYKLRFGQP